MIIVMMIIVLSKIIALLKCILVSNELISGRRFSRKLIKCSIKCANHKRLSTLAEFKKPGFYLTLHISLHITFLHELNQTPICYMHLGKNGKSCVL